MPTTTLPNTERENWSPADFRDLAEARLVMPVWLANRWLFRLPAAVHRSEARGYLIRLMLLLTAAAIHIGLLVLFALFGRADLALVNVGALLWYVMVIAILRAGHHHFAMVLGWTEAYAHGFVFTILLGLPSGYVFYNFAFLVVAFIAYGPRERMRTILIVLAVLTVAAEITFTSFTSPLLPLDAWKEDLLCYVNAFGVLLACVGAVRHFAAVTDHAESRLAQSLVRSDRLLLNILPAPVAERLKNEPGTIAGTFPSVTVLFADIVGFTPLSSRLSGSQVVEMLNAIFCACDGCAERHGVEKIKTIGDAYMAVGGLPEPRADHAAAVCALALDMRAALADYAARTGQAISVRIGIHSGPVVAGVIGHKKFAYDIWGDTVNTASRMESHGLPGQIHVSEATHALVADAFHLEERGLIEIKGKGVMRTFFLQGPVPKTAAEPSHADVSAACQESNKLEWAGATVSD